jgi:hypothetical protein
MQNVLGSKGLELHIEIAPYTEDMIDAVKAFNARLKAGGASSTFPEEHVSSWLPKINDRKIFREHFLAVDGRSVVGGYILKHQQFSFKGKIRSMPCFGLPISEGLVNKTYVGVGALVFRDALMRQPLMFTVGIGSSEAVVTRMLRSMGWSIGVVPFYFRVNNSSRFLRNIVYLRKTKLRRLMLHILALTGLGWIGMRVLQSVSNPIRSRNDSAVAEEVDHFSHWADELWSVCESNYSMLAVRDSTTLNILYPKESGRFICLKVSRGAGLIGWVVVLDTRMQNHNYFGNMRVGSIVDCLALPENASSVIRVAARFLEARGVDLMISNQSHSSWCRALRDSGFIRGPSNYIFAASKKLTDLLYPFQVTMTDIHVNRGDGDGPIHL